MLCAADPSPGLAVAIREAAEALTDGASAEDTRPTPPLAGLFDYRGTGTPSTILAGLDSFYLANCETYRALALPVLAQGRRPDRGLIFTAAGLLQVNDSKAVWWAYDEQLRLVDSFDLRGLPEDIRPQTTFRDRGGNLWIGTRNSGLLLIRARHREVHHPRLSDSKTVAVEGLLRNPVGLWIGDDAGALHVRHAGGYQRVLAPRWAGAPGFGSLVRAPWVGPSAIAFGNTLETRIISPGGHVRTLGAAIRASCPLDCDLLQVAAGGSKATSAYTTLIDPTTYTKRGVLHTPGHRLSIAMHNSLAVFALGAAETATYLTAPGYHADLLPGDTAILHASPRHVQVIRHDGFDTLLALTTPRLTRAWGLSDGRLLVGTRREGLWVYHGDPRATAADTLLPGRHVLDVALAEDGELWVATTRGVYGLRADGSVRIHVDAAAGLISEACLAVETYGDSVYVGTERGLAVFARAGPGERTLPAPGRQVALAAARVRGQARALPGAKAALALGPGDVPLELDLDFVHPASAGEVRYAVRLAPRDEQAQAQQDRTIRFAELAPGRYELTVEARAADGSRYTLAEPLVIEVAKPWYRRWWAVVAGLLALGGVTFGAARAVERRRNGRRAAEDRRRRAASELQLEALRSQINPHFVFNALGSIQYYIQQEDKRSADTYLARFAQLMRRYLDASRQAFTSVGDELALLRQYVELEQMRFDHGFSATLTVADEVDDAEELPSMLVQPVVENAIVHGLSARRDGTGRLEVEIARWGEDGLEVQVRDNGQGVERARRAGRAGHRSRATEITRQRTEALRAGGIAAVEVGHRPWHPADAEFPGAVAWVRVRMLGD